MTYDHALALVLVTLVSGALGCGGTDSPGTGGSGASGPSGSGGTGGIAGTGGTGGIAGTGAAPGTGGTGGAPGTGGTGGAPGTGGTGGSGGAGGSDIGPPTSAPLGALLGVWGSGANDVWAPGVGGIAHFDGHAWTWSAAPNYVFGGISGTSASDVWVTGKRIISDVDSSPVIEHWDGTTWSSSPIGPGQFTTSIWAVAPDDVWAALGPNFLHWNGAAWSTSNGNTTDQVVGIWASGANDVWAPLDTALMTEPFEGAVNKWGGTAWAREDVTVPSLEPNDGTSFSSIWGFAPNDVWVAGTTFLEDEHIMLEHYNGSAWVDISHSTTSGEPIEASANFIWGSSANDVWVSGQVELAHWNGSLLSRVAVPTENGWLIQGIWGSAPNDVWLVGFVFDNNDDTGFAVHWDGTAWTTSYPQ